MHACIKQRARARARRLTVLGGRQGTEHQEHAQDDELQRDPRRPSPSVRTTVKGAPLARHGCASLRARALLKGALFRLVLPFRARAGLPAKLRSRARASGAGRRSSDDDADG